tara:strand:+ start:3635 stop:5719 length:2085 start_codon:yes stop_codon:yes gene_type:complete
MTNAVDKARIEFLGKLEKRRLAGEKLKPKEGAVLERAKELGTFKRSGALAEIKRQFKGEQGKENTKTVGGIGADSAAAFGGAKLASKIPGKFGALAKLLLGGVAAKGSNEIVNQQMIHGKSMDQVDQTESNIAGAAEVVIPPALRTAGKVAKGVGAVGSDAYTALVKLLGGGESKSSSTGNLLRQLLGKSAPEDPDVAVQAGNFIEDTATKIRSGERPVNQIDPDTGVLEQELKDQSLKHVNDVKLSTRVATEFRSRIVELMDGIATKSIAGQNAMTIQKGAGQDILESGINDFVRKFTSNLTPTQLSKQVTQAVKGNIEFAESLRKRNFITLDFLGSKVEDFKGVDLSEIQGGFVSFREAVSLLDKAAPVNAGKILKKLKAAANEVDAGQGAIDGTKKADDLRAAFAEAPGTEGNVENIISQSATQLLRTAVLFNKKNAALINNTSIRNIAKANPEVFLDQLFKSGRSDTLRAVMTMTDEAGEQLLNESQKDGIRAAFLGTIKGKGKYGASGLLTRSSNQIGPLNVLSGDKLLNNLNNAEGTTGSAFGRAMFPGTGFGQLKKFARYLQSQQRETQGAVGAISFVLGAPSAVQSLIGVGVGAVAFSDQGAGNNLQTYMTVAGAGTILLGPKGMAAFLNNPKTRDTLLNGIAKNSLTKDMLNRYMQSVVGQTMANKFGATFIPEDEKEELFNAND